MLETLPEDAIQHIFSYCLEANDSIPPPRSVSREWMLSMDAAVYDRYHLQVRDMLRCCSIRYTSVPVKMCYNYAYATNPSPPLYKCAVCLAPVYALGECRAHRPKMHTFPWARALLGPALMSVAILLAIARS